MNKDIIDKNENVKQNNAQYCCGTKFYNVGVAVEEIMKGEVDIAWKVSVFGVVLVRIFRYNIMFGAFHIEESIYFVIGKVIEGSRNHYLLTESEAIAPGSMIRLDYIVINCFAWVTLPVFSKHTHTHTHTHTRILYLLTN